MSALEHDVSGPTVLSLPGDAADYLYREGSAKTSFWEVVFGSRLAPEKRTKVSALPDGTRRFDVPVASIEAAFFASARTWLAAQPESDATREARAAIEGRALKLGLVGLQPRGVAVARFALSVATADGAPAASAMRDVFAAWLAADRAAVRAIVEPFGFTPAA